MLIRIILRAIPLICVAVFALAVHWADTPLKQARAAAGAESLHLAWGAGQVRCADPWGNLPVSACPPADASRNPLRLH
ncbi:hypothetical protein EQ718_04160 [Paracoccus versutus]|jgi:hypothetical protein|uniref:Uncharacterized protein n=1 Tax=Paracoccus versutus TaxID=34007 RepID=A0A099FMH9_PARVE|nr:MULTISPECIES: hypothetical protein [Paracoccus]SFX28113.1 hypothetical protein SAMN04244548_00740 [Paracoccus pantotrophus]KGJ11481.1 hypothetical protein IT40_06775 [Paracoccus versutus]MBT0779948.1 hypothetical protein [Paracoccus sp. pheM1]RDD72832.1 hypothetical protein DVR11_02565 [Paracoccus versutus]REF67557.1 hypothetical protein BDD41_4587 [Paracoccus versutus]